MKSLKDLEIKFEHFRHNKNEIEKKLLSIEKKIQNHQKQLETITSSETAPKPYWRATTDSSVLNRRTRFVYGEHSARQENNFVFGQIWQENRGRLVMIDPGTHQEPPSVSKIKLNIEYKSTNLDVAAGAACAVLQTGEKISYWFSGYTTEQYLDDMDYMRANSNHQYDHFPRQYTLWHPIGGLASLAGYCSTPFVGAAVLASTGIVDGAAFLDSQVNPNRSVYGRFTKITIGQTEIALNANQWDSSQSNEFISAIYATNPSERSICSIEAEAPFAIWNRAYLIVEIYVSWRDMSDTPQKCEKLQEKMQVLNQQKVRLTNGLQAVTSQIQKVEAEISRYKSPGSVNATLFNGLNVNTTNNSSTLTSQFQF